MDDPKVKITGSKDSLNNWLWEQTAGVVQSGPFQGMQLVKDHVWDDGNLGTKCLGCYEQELHDIIASEVGRLAGIENPTIVNLGCAEGYYAVGMARLLPSATVYIVDIDDASLDLCEQVAALNGVKVARVDNLDDIMAKADLIISDCEGAENAYLNRDKYPSLDHTTMVVETHDLPEVPTSDMLAERFSGTHNVQACLTETVRVPANYEILLRLPSHAKWMAVSEGRPATQIFLYMRPNAKA